MWKQVLWPNLDNDPNNPLYIWHNGQILSDWCGWCLAVVAGSFGARGSSYSAKTAWQACSTKHCDRDLPENVYIPLWYSGGEYGHVVIGYRSGNNLTIWSSPCGQHYATFQVFSGEVNWLLDYVGRAFLVGDFSGWSENVLESRVIELVQTPAPEPTPEPEPEPEPEPIEDNNGKDDDMATPEPAQPIDQQLAGGLIEEAGDNSGWIPTTQAKLVAYIIGDTLLTLAIVCPDVINVIQAPSLTIFGEYLAKVLLELGTCILMIFKLIKKKN